MESQRRKRLLALARALVDSRADEIAQCDECEGYCLREETHVYYGSMAKERCLCPECDLPPCWSSKFSSSRNLRYYVYFDPARSHRTSHVQWGHPTVGNPLYKPNDAGMHVERKRKKEEGS